MKTLLALALLFATTTAFAASQTASTTSTASKATTATATTATTASTASTATTSTATTTTPTYTAPPGIAVYVDGVFVDLTKHQMSLSNTSDCTTSWTLLTAFGVGGSSLTPPSQSLPICVTTPSVTEDGVPIDLTKHLVWIYSTDTVEHRTTVTTY